MESEAKQTLESTTDQPRGSANYGVPDHVWKDMESATTTEQRLRQLVGTLKAENAKLTTKNKDLIALMALYTDGYKTTQKDHDLVKLKQACVDLEHEYMNVKKNHDWLQQKCRSQETLYNNLNVKFKNLNAKYHLLEAKDKAQKDEEVADACAKTHKDMLGLLNNMEQKSLAVTDELDRTKKLYKTTLANLETMNVKLEAHIIYMMAAHKDTYDELVIEKRRRLEADIHAICQTSTYPADAMECDMANVFEH